MGQDPKLKITKNHISLRKYGRTPTYAEHINFPIHNLRPLHKGARHDWKINLPFTISQEKYKREQCQPWWKKPKSHVIQKSCHHHVIRHLTYLLALNPSFWSGNSYYLSIFSYKFPAPHLTLYPYMVPLFAPPILCFPQAVPPLMALSP